MYLARTTCSLFLLQQTSFVYLCCSSHKRLDTLFCCVPNTEQKGRLCPQETLISVEIKRKQVGKGAQGAEDLVVVILAGDGLGIS